MAEEIVIEHVSRTLSKLFAWMGLICSTIMIILYFAVSESGYSDVRIPGLSAVIVVLSLLSIYSLSANKPWLETCEDGIMAGGLVRWYCPWSNIKDIAVIDVERRVAYGLRAPFKELVIKLHSPDKVYYDNWLHRALSHWVVKDRGIILSLETRTAMTKDQFCAKLRERWRQATRET